MIKNLSQLKKVIAAGNVFVIKHHRVPEFIGQRRKVNVIQTNAVYTVVPDQPKNRVTLANNNMGSRLDYGKASEWEFNNGMCSLYKGDHRPEHLVISFVFE